jgi:hypothetical protein
MNNFQRAKKVIDMMENYCVEAAAMQILSGMNLEREIDHLEPYTEQEFKNSGAYDASIIGARKSFREVFKDKAMAALTEKVLND